MVPPWLPPPVDPRLPAPYLIGFELAAGRVVWVMTADSLLWGQVHLIQLVAALQAAGDPGVVVLVQRATGLVCERVVVVPNPSPEP